MQKPETLVVVDQSQAVESNTESHRLHFRCMLSTHTASFELESKFILNYCVCVLIETQTSSLWTPVNLVAVSVKEGQKRNWMINLEVHVHVRVHVHLLNVLYHRPHGQHTRLFFGSYPKQHFHSLT